MSDSILTITLKYYNSLCNKNNSVLVAQTHKPYNRKAPLITTMFSFALPIKVDYDILSNKDDNIHK